jgi:hypothetical protein
MKLGKSILDLAIAVSIVWWVFVRLTSGYLGLNRSRTAVPTEGRIFPFHIWGIVVYLTRGEYALAGFIPYYFLIALLLFAMRYCRKVRGSA